MTEKTARDRALEKRRWHEEQIRKLNEWLALHDELLGDEERESATSSTTREQTQAEERGSLEPTKSGIGLQRTTPTPELEHLAVKILRENGQPLTRGPLAEALEARGAVIGGRNPIANLSSKLTRSKLLRSTDHGYWPKDDPLPNNSSGSGSSDKTSHSDVHDIFE